MTLPPPRSLGKGVYLIPLPLPFKSPPWVNTYVIESADGLLLLDCGTDWDQGRDALRDGFAALGLEESSVHTLVASHLHLDHVGMSKRLVDEWGCRFVMHEWATTLVNGYNDTAGFADRIIRIASFHGVPDEMVEAASRIVRPDFMPVIDGPSDVVADGDTMDLGGGRTLDVIHTPGHEPAHICLQDSTTGALFSGDHVLPRISPVIMWTPEFDDTLGDYIHSLEKLLTRNIGITHPAHGTTIEHGDERIRQLLLHHDRRLLDMAELVREGETTAWQVMLESFRPNLDAMQSRLAFLETLAHLERLKLIGRIQVEERDGTVYYRA